MHSARPADTFTRSDYHSASSGLWGHLLRQKPSQLPPSTTSTSSTLGKLAPTVAPLDKAGASTRILLHDTQAHLEKFTGRVTQITTGLEDAKKELITVQRLYQDEHEQLEERMIALSMCIMAFLRVRGD